MLCANDLVFHEINLCCAASFCSSQLPISLAAVADGGFKPAPDLLSLCVPPLTVSDSNGYSVLEKSLGRYRSKDDSAFMEDDNQASEGSNSSGNVRRSHSLRSLAQQPRRQLSKVRKTNSDVSSAPRTSHSASRKDSAEGMSSEQKHQLRFGQFPGRGFQRILKSIRRRNGAEMTAAATDAGTDGNQTLTEDATEANGTESDADCEKAISSSRKGSHATVTTTVTNGTSEHPSAMAPVQECSNSGLPTNSSNPGSDEGSNPETSAILDDLRRLSCGRVSVTFCGSVDVASIESLTAHSTESGGRLMTLVA